MKLYVIILAAGRGERMRAGKNKALLPIAGRPALDYSLARWAPFAQQMLVAAQPTDIPNIQLLLAAYGPQAKVVTGGNCRAASLAQALAALPPAEDASAELIAVHDAARPLTAASDIQRVICAAQQRGAAILAAPVTDTIHYCTAEGSLGDIVPREQLVAAQTPQIFRRDWLEQAYEKTPPEQLAAITDDAALVQALGYNCVYVPAKQLNIKMTTPQDLEVLCALVLATTRTV